MCRSDTSKILSLHLTLGQFPRDATSFLLLHNLNNASPHIANQDGLTSEVLPYLEPCMQAGTFQRLQLVHPYSNRIIDPNGGLPLRTRLLATTGSPCTANTECFVLSCNRTLRQAFVVKSNWE